MRDLRRMAVNNGKKLVDVQTYVTSTMLTVTNHRVYVYADGSKKHFVTKHNKVLDLLLVIFTSNIAIAVYWLVAIYAITILLAALPVGNGGSFIN